MTPSGLIAHDGNGLFFTHRIARGRRRFDGLSRVPDHEHHVDDGQRPVQEQEGDDVDDEQGASRHQGDRPHHEGRDCEDEEDHGEEGARAGVRS